MFTVDFYIFDVEVKTKHFLQTGNLTKDGPKSTMDLSVHVDGVTRGVYGIWLCDMTRFVGRPRSGLRQQRRSGKRAWSCPPPLLGEENSHERRTHTTTLVRNSACATSVFVGTPRCASNAW